MGRRARPDAVSALALFQVRRRLRWRWPPQSAPQRAGRGRFDRKLPRLPRLAARPALAAGRACSPQPALAGSRPHHSASPLQMGSLGGAVAGWRTLVRRGPAGLAGVANGTIWSGITGVRQFPDLPQVEPVAQLLSHRRTSGGPPRRRTTFRPRQCRGAGVVVAADEGAAAAAGAARLLSRRGRWQARRRNARGRQGRASEVGLARGFLSNAGAG